MKTNIHTVFVCGDTYTHVNYFLGFFFTKLKEVNLSNQEDYFIGHFI